ncbi:hypothetical protein [Sporosarcina sp. G11-34]|uniref:hypothetical protein n=1 Tax=Sporosarcina sp. G11-34 TaxID=2849605 RepID=UPI0022A9E03C|nr:hypothetical protein [Sporosarcina sp. G11-34]
MLSGCVRPTSGIRIQNETNADIGKAEEVFKDDERLASAVAIFHEKEIIAGVSVKTFSRFHKNKIEEELTKRIEELYKDFDVTVSADGKFIYETTKMMNGEAKDKELSKSIKKLKSLSEEET